MDCNIFQGLSLGHSAAFWVAEPRVQHSILGGLNPGCTADIGGGGVGWGAESKAQCCILGGRAQDTQQTFGGGGGGG